MLFIETLLRKRYFTKPNGDTVIDLTFSSINLTAKTPTEVNVVMLTEDMAMRPDMVAKAVYGDDSKLDFILKYNGVSNPFSVNAGDIFVVPDPLMMARMFMMPEADDTTEYNTNIRDFNKIDPLTKKDNRRLEMLKLKAKTKEMLPPNVNKEGDTNIKYRDGKIIFGEDVTVINKKNCPETLTRVRIK